MASRGATAAPGEPQNTAGVSQATPESFNFSDANHRLLDEDFDAFFDLPAEPLENLPQLVWDELHEVVEVPTTPAPAPVSAPISAPVTHAPQVSGTWSQPANEPALNMGPGDLFGLPDFFADFVQAPIDNGIGREGSAGLGVNFNSNGLDATLTGPFNFLSEGFDFQNTGFLPAANSFGTPASLQPVQGLQSNCSGVMTNFYGSGQNAYNGSSTVPGTYGFVQNGQNEFSAGPQNYATGHQVKNEVSPHANDFVFVHNDFSTQPNDFIFVQNNNNNNNQFLAQPGKNFGQSANVSGHGTQEVPYTFSDSEHASQATPHSEGSNGFDHVHVEEAGSVNPVGPTNPSPHAGNLGQSDMDAIYQQFMNSQGFRRAVPAPTVPAPPAPTPAPVPAPRRNRASTSAPARRGNRASPSGSAPRRSRASASVPASKRSRASAQASTSAHFLPTTTVPPPLPAATAYMAPPPVVATNTSTGATAPPVPATSLGNTNNVPLAAQNYVPFINDDILPPNPNGPRSVYPPFSNRFATGEEAKAWRKRSRGMIKEGAPDLLRVKHFGRDYWVRRIYESMIDVSNIDDGKDSPHRRRIVKDQAHEPWDLEATAHHIFDRAVAVHEVGWNRSMVYYKEAKRGKLIDLGEKCLEKRLTCICMALQQQKAVVDDAVRGGITLRLLCDNPTARAATKKSNNTGNRKRGMKLKALKELGIKVPDVPKEGEEPEELEEPEESEESEESEGPEEFE